MYVCMFVCMYVCMCVPLWDSQFFTDLAHIWHARPLGQQEGHRLYKVALQGCFEAKIQVEHCTYYIGHR